MLYAIKKKIPKIGFRIIKSAVAVALCFLVDFFRNGAGIVFYSQLSALWCMQVYRTNTKKNAIQRTLGTIIGALYGLIFLMINGQINSRKACYDYKSIIIISLMIIVVLYTTVIIRKKQASYFSCVVFLSIVVNHIGDTNPYLFVLNRFLDTMIGIIIGIGVNNFVFPARKQRDILFLSTMDDTLLNKSEKMSDYSRVELNRMIDDGMNFTIATMRTPAIIAETMKDIRLKFPVIAMDGAVLYDMVNNRYIKKYTISAVTASEIKKVLDNNNMRYFTNIVVDDSLFIYYEGSLDEIQTKMVDSLYSSPYRNYIKRTAPADEDVLYFMVFDKEETIENLYYKLLHKGFFQYLKIVKHNSYTYERYSYLRIFNKNAGKENMTEYLKKYIGINKVVTLGTIPNTYDVTIDAENANQAVKCIKNLYEKPFWKK